MRNSQARVAGRHLFLGACWRSLAAARVTPRRERLAAMGACAGRQLQALAALRPEGARRGGRRGQGFNAEPALDAGRRQCAPDARRPARASAAWRSTPRVRRSRSSPRTASTSATTAARAELTRASASTPPLASLRYWVLGVPRPGAPPTESARSGAAAPRRTDPGRLAHRLRRLHAAGASSCPARLTLRARSRAGAAGRGRLAAMSGRAVAGRRRRRTGPRRRSSISSCTSPAGARTATTSCRPLFQLIDLCDTVTHRGARGRADRAPRGPGRRAARRRISRCGPRGRCKPATGAHRWARASGSHKRIPMGGGLGGGSSDAATTLLALNSLWGCGLPGRRAGRLGLPLGADVPVFVEGSSAWAEGVGERLTPVSCPRRWYVIIHPGVSGEHPGGLPEP